MACVSAEPARARTLSRRVSRGCRDVRLFCTRQVPAAFMQGMHLSLVVGVVELFLGTALSVFCLKREL
jgi:hypothetical protein